MIGTFRKLTVAAIAALATLSLANPAQAHRGRGGDDAAIAIGAGIVGLAVGAAIASDRRDRHYYHTGYAYNYQPRYRGYYHNSYPRYRSHDRHYRYRDYRIDRRYYRDHSRYRDSYRGYYRR